MFFTLLLNDARELSPISSSGNMFHNLAQVLCEAKSDCTVGEKGICRFDDDQVFTLCWFKIGQNNFLNADRSSPAKNLNTKVEYD